MLLLSLRCRSHISVLVLTTLLPRHSAYLLPYPRAPAFTTTNIHDDFHVFAIRCVSQRTMATEPSPVSLSTTPAAGQRVAHAGAVFDTIREGRAFILIPPNTQTSVDPAAATGKKQKGGAAPTPKADDVATHLPQSVFYNPIQQFNRDLSVLAIKAFGEDWLRKKRAANTASRERRARKRTKRGIEEVKDGDAVDREDGIKRVKESKTAEEAVIIGNEGNKGVAEEEMHEVVTDVELQTQRTGELIDDAPETGSAEKQETKSREQPRFRILDALSATGLRALRYAKEIPFVTAVVANDMNPNAIKSMAMNIEHNGLQSTIKPNLGDAMGHMYSVAFPPTSSHGPHHVNQKYDVIDLDPYGTAAPFIDAALQALNDGGLLCVTCTDSGVFASTGYSEKTYALYGGMPVKGPHMHEGGLRLIINSVATSAAKYGMAIEPLLSLSIDYYIRIFIRVRKSPFEVKFLAGKTMLVYGCDVGCGAWTMQTLARNIRQSGKSGNLWFKHSIAQAPTADRFCEHCGSKMHLAGPMWAGRLHNQAFIEKILDDLQNVSSADYETSSRIEGMLSTALDELSVHEKVTQYDPDKNGADDTAELIPPVPAEMVDHHPFFFNPSALSKVIHCIAPSDSAFKGALRKAGYRATRSHCQAGSIKTDAKWTVLWEIMREWVRQKHPIKEGSLKEGQPGWRIMQAARSTQPNVNHADDAAAATTEAVSPQIITDHDDAASKAEKVDGHGRIKVIFDEVLGRDAPGKRLVRYQQNPRENWGPMTKAKGNT